MIDPCFCGDLLLYLAKIGIMEKFRAIRRKDRVWDEAAARELLDRGEYGFLAMCGVGGYGYGLPMSYVADGDRIYFHCAPEGEKLDAICLCKRAFVRPDCRRGCR